MNYVVYAKDAEEIALKGSEIRNAGDAFAALLGLAITCVGVDQLIKTGEMGPIRKSRGELLRVCDDLVNDAEWEPTAEWPYTKAEMKSAFIEGFGSILEDIRR